MMMMNITIDVVDDIIINDVHIILLLLLILLLMLLIILFFLLLMLMWILLLSLLLLLLLLLLLFSALGIFIGVWVTASLLKSPGLFSVFWPFSIVLSFGWSPLVRQLPSPPVSLVNLLVTVAKAPITIGIIVTSIFHSFFQFPSKVEVYFLPCKFFQFYSVVSRNSKVDNFASSLFFLGGVFDYFKVWSSGRDYVIRLYVKVP